MAKRLQKRRRPKQQNRIKQILKARKGVTLVELVVTFALMSLFATSVCMMLSSAINVYHQIRGLSNARQVSDTLLDKIAGTIEGARDNGTPATEGKVMKLYEEGKVIELIDKTGSPIAISSTESGSAIVGREKTTSYPIKQLLIFYYPVTKPNNFDAVDWTFDQAAYMGFEIESLKFTWVAGEDSDFPKNVIKIELVLHSNRYGSYPSERYVECYNFDKVNSDKIEVK